MSKKIPFGTNFEEKELIERTSYIRDRLQFKIKLYYKMSARNKLMYRLILLVSLLLGSLTPIVINWDFLQNNGIQINNMEYAYNDLFATIFSIVVVILVSMEITFRFREQFKNYKEAEDKLTTELYLFQTNTTPYDAQDETSEELKFRRLVQRVEGIIGKERMETINKLTENQAEQK